MKSITQVKRHGVRLFMELRGIAGMFWNPHAIQNIYRIEDGLLGSKVTAMMLDHLRNDPVVAQFISRRYLRGQVPPLAELRRLPDGTLGREYVRLIDDYGFNPGYYQELRVTNDVTYALARVRETHDIWHVVLGFYPTPIGEIGLKAFELAQLRRPIAAVIVAGGLMRYVLKTPAQFGDVLGAIVAGYEMGRRARPLLAERWEEAWGEPVAQIRRRLNIAKLSPQDSGRDDPMGVKPSRAKERNLDQTQGASSAMQLSIQNA